MKRRLLAFFLAFAMMVSLMPVSTFAAEEETETPFISIVTDSGEEVTAEYVKTIQTTSAWSESIDAPYYHATIPEGTQNVLVTYPKGTALFSDSGDTNLNFFIMSMTDSAVDHGEKFSAEVNEDGSTTVTIPVEYFILNEDGTGIAVGMACTSDSGSLNAVNFFSFSYAAKTPASHTVTLTSGEGYTLTGEDTVEDGADYTFSVVIDEGYEKTETFAVKANGEALTANSDGSYTVEAVSADLTITVEGVAKKQTEPEQPFTSILTKDNQEVTVEYVATVPFTLNGVTYADAPYYRVTVPAKTRSVYVTYPADVEFDADGVAFTYALTIPDYTAKVGLVGYSVKTNSDGSKLVCIDVEDFLLDDNGAGKAVSLKYSGSQDPVSFFSFSYDPQTVVTHSVKLPTGEGYTLKGETTVQDGDDYTFTITIADGYEKTDSFAIKVNGNTVQPNANGNCTVKSVSEDLTVTVEGVAKKQEASTKRFTAIVTDDGKEVSVEFKGMIPVETYQTFNDGPYYHVTVPAGTKSVQVTYPASVNIAGGSNAYFYTLSVPDYTVGFGDGSFAVTTNSDGSKTMTIPVAPYLLDASGKGTAASAEYSGSFDPITFFSFAYEGGAAVSHNVTLTAGDGYTLTGEDTVEDGADYTFSVVIDEGYEKTETFAVKANGEALTANSDGSYTVEAVSADLTITVEGVAEKQTTPEVPFTAIVTDNDEELTAEYVETVAAESAQDGTITAPYYHVVVPAGTEYVKVTYPESAALYQPIEGTVYWCGLTLPGHTSGRGQSFPADPNEDGSVTAIIYVSNFVLNEDGTGAAVGVVSANDSGNFTTPNFFSFSYAAKPASSHAVTLTAGTGYTLTGETTVEDGADFTFTVAIAEGYEKTEAFAVKANGEALTANADGSYTIKAVSADLTVTVEGVAKKQTTPEVPFTAIVTDNDEELTAEYVETVAAESAQDGTITAPYYHVVVPAGTEYVKVTYPESAALYQPIEGTVYWCGLTLPGHTSGRGQSFPAEPNENGSITAIIYVSNFVLNEDGTGAAVGVVSADDSGNFTTPNFFSFGYAAKPVTTHTVTLTAGTGYTLTGDTTVADGESYTFKLAVSSGYGKSDDFVVKANGEVLTANADGSYTVNNVTSDLTVTVKGVTQLHTITLPKSRKGYAITDYTSGEELGTELEIAEGQTYKFKITLKDGYAVRNKDFNIQYNSIYNVVKIEEDDASAVITMSKVVEDDKMTIKGVKKILNVTVPEGEGYTVVPDESKMTLPILSGENYYFKVVIADGYAKSDDFAVQAIYTNGTRDLTEVDGIYTIPNPTQDQEIKVTGVIKRTVSHTVTLTPGTGYTLTGETTVEDGADYSFTVTVAEGYVKSGEYAVKADDKELKANEDGSYTVKNVTANVTVTVEGLMTPPANGLSALRFTASSGSSAKAFDMTPAFDPAVKEYTILIPDSESALYAWAKLSEGLSSKGTIQAEWISQTGSSTSTKTQTIKSGASYGQSLSGAVSAGDKTCTVSIKITDGEYTDSYTVTTVRTDPTLKSLNLDTVKLNKTFASSTKVYTATTVDESVTVNAVPRSSSYTVTINGKSDKTVALEMGENVIEIVVENARGDKNTYTVTVTRVAPIAVTLDVTPAGAKVSLTDAKGAAISPDSDGVYHLMSGSTYYYTANAKGYKRTTGSFTLTESGSAKIEMEVDTSKPVTVYFSFSHDDKFELCEETGAVMALKKVTVPYFDLANYGMEGFYFKSENYGAVYPDHPGQGSALEPGTAEYAYGKVTMLHLFIYATEVYYCGIDPDDAGQGYLYDSGLLGTDLFSYSGSTGSIFLQTIWNYDLNLNYYLNHEYPLASEGWGSTCDQILLHDDDVVTLGHFTSWSFFQDSTSVFHHFEADNATPTQGDQITLSVIRDGENVNGDSGTAHTLVTYCPKIYCAPVDEVNDGDVTTWTYVGTADEEGHLTVDTSELAPGEYIFAMAGQYGAEYTDAICSTPGGMRITVLAKTAVKGDVDGDGDVDAMDATALYNAISNGDATDAVVSDFNGDGVVDIFDVMALYASVASGK